MESQSVEADIQDQGCLHDSGELSKEATPVCSPKLLERVRGVGGNFGRADSLKAILLSLVANMLMKRLAGPDEKGSGCICSETTLKSYELST